MRFRVLACDYDRTIALDAAMGEPVRRSLREVIASGRSLILVTGRTMDELRAVFDEFGLFARVVVENGAIVHDPSSGQDRMLAASIPPALVAELRRLRVEPLVVGRVVCSTAVENEPAVRRAVTALGLQLSLVPNRDSIMALPLGVDKGSGLLAALAELGEAPGGTVAVGDGENDVALIDAAAVGVAVDNAVPQLKRHADVVLSAPAGAGVSQLCTSLVRHDLADLLDPFEEPGRVR